jgi:LuxR family maltose regulon positive regulatory protein
VENSGDSCLRYKQRTGLFQENHWNICSSGEGTEEEVAMRNAIMKAKLQPAINGRLLQRERLIEQLQKNMTKRLILMVSCSGSGKTTLAAQFLQSRNPDSVWNNLDLHDQDPAIFFHYLMSALRNHYPHFCKDLEPAQLCSSNLWAPFIQEIQEVVIRPCFIVFDNYESLLGATVLNQFMTYLLQHLPPTVHLVILTNQKPRFSLRQLRLVEDVYQVNATDLAFTPDETRDLLEKICHLSVPQSTIEQIVRETEGWPLALVLFAQNLNLRPEFHPSLSVDLRERYKEDLYEYFLEEILRSYPQRFQDVLISSAFLPFISIHELKAFLGQTDADYLLHHIAESNIPIFPLNGGIGTYRYHNLFRDFLLEKMREQKSESDIMKLHHKAAVSLEKNHPVEAIDHYLRSGLPDEAVKLVEQVGWPLLREGQYETLKRTLSKIPIERKSRNPILFYYLGRTQEIQGHIEEAQEHYQKALTGLKGHSPETSAACNKRLGILELKKDRFAQARNIFINTIGQLEGSELHKDVVKRLIATHANLAKVYCKLEEDNKASMHIGKARALFDLYGGPNDDISLLQAEALEYAVTGQFQEVIDVGGKGKKICQKSDFKGLIPLFDHYLAFAHLYMGNFKEALSLAEEGLSIMKRQGVEDNIFGALLSDLGHCRLAKGQVQEGFQSLCESSRIFKKGQNFCGQFWNASALCLMAVRQGDLSMAWDYWRMMERNSRQLSLPMQHAMTLIMDGFLSAQEKSTDRTLERIAEAKPFLRRSQQKMSIFHAHVLTMKSCLNIGREDLAEEAFLNAISLGSLQNFYFTFHYELDWFLPFAENMVKRQPHLMLILPGHLQDLAKDREPALKNALHACPIATLSGQADLLDLHVYALGPFRIVANGREVSLERCPSKKALTLVKYLFFKRHEGGIFLDEALELLWPEMAPEMTRSNLRVILSMLRKVFKGVDNGPDGFPNLIRNGNKLSLSLGKRGWTDVDEFLDQVKLAGYKEKRNLWAEASIHYEKIIELYKGDFLYDELYSDWCYMEREYLRDQFLTSLIRMAECQERLESLSDAIGTLYHLLKIDRYREDAYLKLMSLCASAGRKGEIIRVYKLCKKAIEEDLNLELSLDIRELYGRLANCTKNDGSMNVVGISGVR